MNTLLLNQAFYLAFVLYRYNYGRLVVFLGLLNSNLQQSISYGDGERETLTLKFTIPIFRRMGHTKYAYMQVKRQIMLQSIFSEALAYEYKHNTTKIVKLIADAIYQNYRRKRKDFIIIHNCRRLSIYSGLYLNLGPSEETYN